MDIMDITLTEIVTKRLTLIPMTEQLCRVELSQPTHLSSMLDANVPKAWPPSLVTKETLQEFINLLTCPEGSRFFAYYWILNPPFTSVRMLIGNGGFIVRDGCALELGYSVLDEYQGLGYATEAVDALIGAAFSLIGVKSIFACTYPDHLASIRVLEKNKFKYIGKGTEEGTITFELTRKANYFGIKNKTDGPSGN